jgi:hypothetical protein
MSGLVASVVVLVTNTSLYLSPGLRPDGNKNVPASEREAIPATATAITNSVFKFASSLIRTLLPDYVFRYDRWVSTVARTERNGVDKLQL